MSTATTTETRRVARAAAFTGSRRHVLALVVPRLAALLDTVDVTVVNVAMPAIGTSLHFSEGTLLATTAAAALVLLREDGRGQSVNLVELQTAGALRPGQSDRRDSHEHVVRR